MWPQVILAIVLISIAAIFYVDFALRRYRAMLEDCEDQFRYYAEQHRAKGTVESAGKAAVNEMFAGRIHELLRDVR